MTMVKVLGEIFSIIEKNEVYVSQKYFILKELEHILGILGHLLE
jgi:hypothetical protein